MAEISSIYPFIVNFLIVVIVIALAARKPLRRLVYQRHEHIRDFVESSAQELERARARDLVATKQLAGAEKEASELAAKEIEMAEREAREILDSGDREVRRLSKEAESMAGAMAADAGDRLRLEFVDEILARASSRLTTGLKKDDHSEILRRAENSIGAEA